MCKLIYCEKESKKLLSNNYLEYMVECNRDGIGYSFFNGFSVVTNRNITLQELKKIIKTEWQWIIIHARLATSGKNMDMTHPHAFTSSDGETCQLYHNGVFPSLSYDKINSDTRKLATILNGKYNPKTSGDLLELLCQSTRNKLAVIHGCEPYIYGKSLGLWTENLWDSNGESPLDFKRMRRYKKQYSDNFFNTFSQFDEQEYDYNSELL